MKKFLILPAIAAVFCLSFATSLHASTVVPKAPKPHKTKAAFKKPYATFPTGYSWTIGYDMSNPWVSLNWSLVDNPYLGNVPFTFKGNTQYVNPHVSSYILWIGPAYTLLPNQTYTMNIAGVNYYFHLPTGGSGICVITGHS
jgi:hypothetical protein